MGIIQLPTQTQITGLSNMKAFISTVLLVASASQGARAAPSEGTGTNSRGFFNRPVGGYNAGVTGGIVGGVNTGIAGVNTGFGGVNPVVGGVNTGFGGVNSGYGVGGGLGSSSGSCRYWCRTPQGQAYCCEGGNEVASLPTVKPGQCPPVRLQCPPTRLGFRPPQQCSNDSRCPGVEKCCFDTCLLHHTCKVPISIYGNDSHFPGVEKC